tara:strand:- start:24096 stop:24407 length:312 start_codon:yes stop_codon:yes gene_type:complete
MKFIEVQMNNGEIKLIFHPIIKAMFVFYVGAVFLRISTQTSREDIFSDVMLIVISVLAGGFMMYGIIIFINDLKSTKTFKELVTRIQNNINNRESEKKDGGVE